MTESTDIFPPFIDDLLECRVAGSNGGVSWLNVLYAFGDPGNSFITNAGVLAGSLFTFYEELAVEVMGNFWSVTDIQFLDRSVANGGELTATPGTPIVGDAALEALPLQTQLVVTWKTANSGRRYRGRTYLCGFTIDNNDGNGAPATATIDAVQLAADNLLTALDGDNMSLAVLSRGKLTTNAVPPEDPATDWEGFATPVMTALVRGGWDVLRSRRP